MYAYHSLERGRGSVCWCTSSLSAWWSRQMPPWRWLQQRNYGFLHATLATSVISTNNLPNLCPSGSVFHRVTMSFSRICKPMYYEYGISYYEHAFRRGQYLWLREWGSLQNVRNPCPCIRMFFKLRQHVLSHLLLVKWMWVHRKWRTVAAPLTSWPEPV